MKVVTRTEISACPLISRGKVRDIYSVDDNSLLIVTTDRMSAFDVMMGRPIPYKGVILNQITLFWMDMFKDIIPNHIIESDVSRFPAELAPWKDELEGRAVIVRKAKPLPIECIVRGYLSGSGWKAYQKTGEIYGHKLPAGLRESDKLETAIFTPSTKAEIGDHDENISFERCAEILGEDAATQLRDLAIKVYSVARDHAAENGIIIADTKFEFGVIDGQIILADEVLTPDSSRFWPGDAYEPGRDQASFDKQYVRDWLNANWDRQGNPPHLPQEVIERTSQKYIAAYEKISGKKFEF